MQKTIALFLCLAGVLAIVANTLPASDSTPPFFDDAPLRAIHFVDKSEGWAVGDEGVIWHSVSGGDHWERQPSGTRASLRAIHFLNPYFGWVVGSEYDPATGSVGVVLVTKDGGLKWTKVLSNTFPGLSCVGFLNEKDGFLAGDCPAGFPSGVFQTKDGGKTWSSVEGQAGASWRSMGFGAEGNPILAGVQGALAMVLDGKIVPLKIPGNNPADYKSIHLSTGQGVLVGKSGTILQSDKASNFTNWNMASTKVSTDLLGCMQLNCVGGFGKTMCAFGFPGSMIIRRGQENSWSASQLDNTATIHGLKFLDELKGWAVGDLGTILKTLDGGGTWKCVKKGASQHRVLLLSSGSTTMLPELAGLLGYAEGQIVGACCLEDQENKNGQGAIMDVRLDLAARGAGASDAIILGKYPRMLTGDVAPALLLEHWDKFHEQRSADRLVHELALLIRERRPDVVVFSESMDEFGTVHSQTVFHALLAGVIKANEPNLPFFEESGLKPWEVKQVICPEGFGKSRIRMDAVTVHRGLQTPLFDLAISSRKVLGQSLKVAELGFVGHGKSRQIKNFLDGLPPGVPGVNVRELAPPELVDKSLVRAYQSANLLRRLADSPLDSRADPGVILSSMTAMLEKLPDDRAALTLSGIGTGFYENGHWAHAREVFKQIIASYPASKQASEAFAWLIIHDASSEARRRYELNQFISQSEKRVGVPGAEKLPVTLPKDLFSGDNSEEDSKNGKKVRPKLPDIPKIESETRGDKKVLSHNVEAKAWLQNSIFLSSRFQSYGPLAMRNPYVFFSVLAAKRNLGLMDQVQDDLGSFLGRGTQEVWKQNALAETWIMARKGACPKKSMICVKKTSRPLLDGHLNDACWEGLAEVMVGPAGGELKDLARFKVFYDDLFLYVGARCNGVSRPVIPVSNKTRRDGNLAGKDRIFFCLDMDRDYTTSYKFEVSADGNAIDSCWNDKSWNPSWFFKVVADGKEWTMEAAIPWSSLMGAPITDGKSWAVNFGRVISGGDVYSWSGNAVEIGVLPGLEHSGLMFFQSNETGSKSVIPANKP